MTNSGGGTTDTLNFTGSTLSLSAGLTNTGAGILIVNPSTSFTGPILSSQGTLKIAKPGVVSIQDTVNSGTTALAWDSVLTSRPGRHNTAPGATVTTPAFTVTASADLPVSRSSTATTATTI